MSVRVLVIEDNAANLELMRYLLAAAGLEPILATDGEAGLALAARDQPDVILCDVRMPGRDGYAVARAVKENADLRGIPLCAVSALAMPGDRERALAAGFDAYLTKPIDPATFVAQILDLLPAPTQD